VEVIDECQSLVAFPSDVMKWNDWQLLGDEIGKGAYGRVYKGLDLENGDFVRGQRSSRSRWRTIFPLKVWPDRSQGYLRVVLIFLHCIMLE
jgi:hypothetical protein